MLIDRVLAQELRSRVEHNRGSNLLLDAWSDEPQDQRAAMLLAAGDTQIAGLYGSGFKALAAGDVVQALGEARQARRENSAMRLLEAEALIAAGGIVAGLRRLDALHRAGDAAASLALARRRHLLGDHAGAERAATALPLHAKAVLIGARAALANKRVKAAAEMIEPFLEGKAHCPEPMVAGAMAVVAALVLLQEGQSERLRQFATRLMGPGLPDEMLPTAVRVAWMAGQAAQAWQRCGGDSPWPIAARLELAILAGNHAQASALAERAGSLAAPNATALLMLRGGAEKPLSEQEYERMFGAGVTVHLWRTHPHRWQPWIDAAMNTAADIEIFDLAAGNIPHPQAIPDVLLDDGSLVEVLQPMPIEPRPRGSGAWIGQTLCQGAALDLDWPAEETGVLTQGLPLASSRDAAALWVLAAEDALAGVCEGRLVVAIAPPGDTFWAGPLPERVWPSLRVVRADPRQGWVGAGQRVIAAAQALVSSVRRETA